MDIYVLHNILHVILYFRCIVLRRTRMFMYYAFKIQISATFVVFEYIYILILKKLVKDYMSKYMIKFKFIDSRNLLDKLKQRT